MAIIRGANRAGNEILIDVVYICPVCGCKYDSYEEAEECQKECIEDKYGIIEEQSVPYSSED